MAAPRQFVHEQLVMAHHRRFSQQLDLTQRIAWWISCKLPLYGGDPAGGGETPGGLRFPRVGETYHSPLDLGNADMRRETWHFSKLVVLFVFYRARFDVGLRLFSFMMKSTW